MTITSVRKDPDALTMTIVSEFAADADRVWQLWSDPRLFEQWWGPPGYPVTLMEHALSRGGRIEYRMSSPEGEGVRGYLEVIEADAPHRLVLRDGFASEGASSFPDLPGNVLRVAIDAIDGGGTRMTVETTFANREAMEQFLELGMVEGLAASIGQIDAVLGGASGPSRS